ncbi:MAG: hypothetical protein M9894_23820 [Planctomycetes bacterium]|nr:hypothetical protein [Planctomycetota bacterium]
MRGQIITPLLALAALAAPASAQPLSGRETIWADGVRQELGGSARTQRFTLPRPVEEVVKSNDVARAPLKGPLAHGLRIVAGDDVVERLRFDSPRAAQEYMASAAALEGPDAVAGELRGGQVLLVRGPGAKDPARARALLDAGWKVLPVAEQTDATFARLEDGGLALSTQLESGPLRESVDKALDSIRRGAGGGVTIEWATPGGAHVRFPSGYEAEVRSDPRGASALTSSRPDGVQAMREYLAAVQPPPPDDAPSTVLRTRDPSATEGAAAVVRNLFGD